jgi:hypothetical protein
VKVFLASAISVVAAERPHLVAATNARHPTVTSDDAPAIFGRKCQKRAARRGSINNSPSECARRHAQQEPAEEREKEECAQIVPGTKRGNIARDVRIGCALFQADFRRCFICFVTFLGALGFSLSRFGLADTFLLRNRSKG